MKECIDRPPPKTLDIKLSNVSINLKIINFNDFVNLKVLLHTHKKKKRNLQIHFFDLTYTFVDNGPTF